MKQYYGYIMTNESRTLYTGVTNDLERRVFEHKQKLVPGFTLKYNISKLVYFEITQDVQAAIAWEKQIKGWLRRKKIALIESVNPEWADLSTHPEKIHEPGEILRCARNDRKGGEAS
jgi:putative endonuclease